MKKIERIPIILIPILILNINFFTFNYTPVDMGLNSFNSDITLELESIDTRHLKNPESSTDSINITKTADILDGTSQDVMIVGTLAYVAFRNGGLKIIDISNTSAPLKLGEFDDCGMTYDVFISGL